MLSTSRDPHAEEVADQLDLVSDRKGTLDKVIQKSVKNSIR